MDWTNWENLTTLEQISRADDLTLLVEICLDFMTTEDAVDLGNLGLDAAKQTATAEWKEKHPA